MSWTTNKALVTSILTTGSYTETSNNLKAGEFPSSRLNKSYSLKPLTPQISYLSGNGVISADIAELEVSYIVKDNSDFDTQYDAWKTLLTSLKVYISNNPQEQTFERQENNKLAIGKVLLYFAPTGC